MRVALFTTEMTASLDKFVKDNDVLENGVIFRPEYVAVLYREAMTKEQLMQKKLENTLKVFEDQYIEAFINREFYLQLEKAGKGAMELSRETEGPMGKQSMKSTVTRELANAKLTLDGIISQIVVIRGILKDPPKLENLPTAFNKKDHSKDDKKAA